jgi:16S rRNA (guanine966-N2)-methyltransferase
MRIVAGAAKGRRLASPADGTRPTSDRVREAMFNSLAASVRLDGARVLDLFAGTGAIGLEALSRGASVAVLVEKDRAALDVLRRNVATVGLPGAEVVASPVARFLNGAPEHTYDLVFADPPYGLDSAELGATLGRLGDPRWLATDGVVIIERSARSDPLEWAESPAGFLTPVAERRYGDTVLWYGRRR